MPDYAYDYGRLFIVQEPMRVYSILDNFRQKINLFGLCDPSYMRLFEMRSFLKLEYVCYCFFCPVLMFLSCPVLGFFQRTLPFPLRDARKVDCMRSADETIVRFPIPISADRFPLLTFSNLLSNTLYRECVERKKTSWLTCVDWRSISAK